MPIHKLFKCLGNAQDVRVSFLGIDCNMKFFFMNSREDSYIAILVRPWWLITIQAKKNWEIGLISNSNKNKSCITIYNMNTL